jgi:hypothetical protein
MDAARWGAPAVVRLAPGVEPSPTIVLAARLISGVPRLAHCNGGRNRVDRDGVFEFRHDRVRAYLASKRFTPWRGDFRREIGSLLNI